MLSPRASSRGDLIKIIPFVGLNRLQRKFADNIGTRQLLIPRASASASQFAPHNNNIIPKEAGQTVAPWMVQRRRNYQ